MYRWFLFVCLRGGFPGRAPLGGGSARPLNCTVKFIYCRLESSPARACNCTAFVAAPLVPTLNLQLKVGLNVLSFADGVCFFSARSCRGDSGCAGRLMSAGHLLFCATKKVSKKVAGNAIPRSRLPSERKIAHSRVSSLYPYCDTNVRSREYFLNLQLK